jgi:CRP-like cAMP-binding protein
MPSIGDGPFVGPVAPSSRQFPANRLLAALPPGELARITPHLSNIPLVLGDSLFTPDESIRHVCFPDDGVCAMMAVMRSGTTIEVGTVGNEGMTGLARYFGETTEPKAANVQVPGHGRVLAAEVFEDEMGRRGVFHRLIGYYAYSRMVQLAQSVACNRLHTLEQRACRWLLMTHDRMQGDTFKLTHEAFALILGARRSSVTSIATGLQRAGTIAYRHGTIAIKERSNLESAACECYPMIRDYFDRPFRKMGATASL